jgi:hypothetical protein
MTVVLRCFALSVAVLVLFAGVQIDGATQTARAAAPYHKCGSFRFRGKHTLFAHRYPCRRAERKARYVLAHRHAPPHWKCSLAELGSGFAACHRSRRSWEFVPA